MDIRKMCHHCFVSLLCTFYFLCLYDIVSGHAQSSDHYTLATSVRDESGGLLNASTHTVFASSVGQPTPIGMSHSANYTALSGYIYTIDLTCAPGPDMVKKALADGFAGCSYSHILQIQTGTGNPPLQWSIIDGMLPPGLDLDVDSGELYGIPDSTGTFEFTVLVTDICNGSDTHTFSIHVEPFADIKGDPNLDCTINVLDVLMVANIILDNIDPTEEQSWSADCNGPSGLCDGDGMINVLDAVKIVNLILGLDKCP